MKLQAVLVTNFRSVDHSEQFEIDPVTCLVGKNEAGKSAILLALAALNPHSATPAIFDKERDYPRRLLTQYEDRHGGKDAVAVTTEWRLNGNEFARIATLIGEGVITSEVVIVQRKYGHDIEVEARISFDKALEYLYTRFSLDASERSVLTNVTTTSALITALGELSAPTERHRHLKAHLAEYGSVTQQVNKIIK